MSLPPDADRPPESASRPLESRTESAIRKALEVVASAFRGERLLELVTVLTVLGGSLLILADFLELFRIEAGLLPVEEQSGGEQHSYAMLIVGLGVIGAALLARTTRQWPPAVAVAVLALIALAIALIGDLPEATKSDLVRGARIANADPSVGFWVELAGAVVALAGGLAMAYLLRRRSAESQGS